MLRMCRRCHHLIRRPVRFPFVDISRLVNFEFGVPLLLSGHSLHVTVAEISMQRRTRLGNMLRLSLPIRLLLRHLSPLVLDFFVCRVLSRLLS